MQTQDGVKELRQGAGGGSTEVYNIMADDYSTLEGYNPDANFIRSVTVYAGKQAEEKACCGTDCCN